MREDYATLTKEIREDLKRLVVIGREQGGSLNDIMVSNFYAGLPKAARTEETYNEVLRYLEEKGIMVVNDGVEFFKDLEGMTFSKLPRVFIRRIEENMNAYTGKKESKIYIGHIGKKLPAVKFH